MHLVMSISYLVVLLAPSSLVSLSIVMACAGQIASHNLQAVTPISVEKGPSVGGTYQCSAPRLLRNGGGRALLGIEVPSVPSLHPNILSSVVVLHASHSSVRLTERVHDSVLDGWTASVQVHARVGGEGDSQVVGRTGFPHKRQETVSSIVLA